MTNRPIPPSLPLAQPVPGLPGSDQAFPRSQRQTSMARLPARIYGSGPALENVPKCAMSMATASEAFGNRRACRLDLACLLLRLNRHEA